MHDKPLQELCGWPDVESSASIVRNVKQSLQISKPAGLAAGNWSFVVHTLPALGLNREWAPQNGLSSASVFYTRKITYGNQLNTVASPLPQNMGHVLITFYSDVGAGTDPYRPSDSLGINAQVMDLDDTYLSDPCRMLGSGVEVTNTTAELYRQGTITVCRVPQGRGRAMTYQEAVTNSVITTPRLTNVDLSPAELWPRNLSDAMLIAGSRQWAAAEGAYVVEAFLGQENSPYIAQPGGLWLPDNDYVTNQTIFNNSEAYTPAYNYNNTFGAIAPSTAPVLVPVHSATIIASGLSEQSTFTLNWNCLVESFPDCGDPSICVLAKPSCQYDPVALRLLSEGLGTMPVGCPASDNPGGEWFASLISSIADTIAAPLGFIPEVGPALSLAAKGVGALAGNYGKYLAANSADSKPLLIQKAPPRTQPRRRNRQRNNKPQQKVVVVAPKPPQRGSSRANKRAVSETPRGRSRKPRYLIM